MYLKAHGQTEGLAVCVIDDRDSIEGSLEHGRSFVGARCVRWSKNVMDPFRVAKPILSSAAEKNTIELDGRYFPVAVNGRDETDAYRSHFLVLAQYGERLCLPSE